MNFKKVFSVILVGFLLFTLVGCKDTPDEETSSLPLESSDFVSSEEVKEPEYFINPLTGEKNLLEEQVGYKPVAVAINNLDVAQKVQAGVGKADVVFETEVEGGITRMLALYKAPTKETGKIGTVRSARVVFAELAASMNAFYVCFGKNETHAAPRIKELKLPTFDFKLTGRGYTKDNNGMTSTEHKAYTTGEFLKSELDANGYNTGYSSEPWLSFATDRAASGYGMANSVSVKFSGAQTTSFSYNAEKKAYVKSSNGRKRTDFISGQEETFKNVFVLETNIYLYSGQPQLKKVELKGGKGYYITAGGYEPITWSKSGNYTPISFKAADGSELSVSTGNSYICLIDKGHGSFTAQ